MSGACTASCELELNNDIMGIGVRAALYAQIILAWFMSLKWPNTFIKNSRAAYMTATAILVASLTQWKKGELSVLDALVVSLMTSMMTIFIVVSGTSREEAKPATTRSKTTSGNPGTDQTQAGTSPDNTQPSSALPSAPQPASIRPRNPEQSTPQSSATHPESVDPAGSPITVPAAAHLAPPNAQPRTTKQEAAAHASDSAVPTYQPRKSYTQWFIRCCFVNIWGAWSFIIWKDPVHFGLEGSKANCTNDGVTIWVFGQDVHAVTPWIRIAALVLVSILYFIAICSLFFTLENVLEPAMRAFSSIGNLLMTINLPSKKGNATPRAATNKPLHEDPVINRIHQLLHISAFGTLLYLLISTEMTVRWNDKDKEMMDWSYGQVIALLLLLQQFNDLCSTYIEGREDRQNRKEQEEREKKWSQSTATNTTQTNIPMTNLTPTIPGPSQSA